MARICLIIIYENKLSLYHNKTIIFVLMKENIIVEFKMCLFST